MKKSLLLLLSVSLLIMAGCSRSDKPQSNATPQSTPDAERLKADAERLQQATANAAREREKANQTPSPSPSVSP